LQLTSLRTAVVDHRSPSARAERRCAARSGLVTTRPRQFCIQTLHWLPIYYRIQFKIALLVYNALAGRCPEYINDIVAPVVSVVLRYGGFHCCTGVLRYGG